VETETDPEALSHDLMQVSFDGTLLPPLLDRLRRVEEIQQLQRREEWLRQDVQAGTGTSPPAARSSSSTPSWRPSCWREKGSIDLRLRCGGSMPG
jgi:hypothetical protein